MMREHRPGEEDCGWRSRSPPNVLKMVAMTNPFESQMIDGEVDPRAQQLLKLLVEHYIAAGTPVASKALAMRPEVSVSSATVRNVMGDLEALGLVRSPHTSAGKVPTQLGLRFFVDTLLSFEPWQDERIQEIESELDPDMTPAELLAAASDLLSQFTQMTCLITTPRRNQVNLRQVEFLRLDDQRVLVILVLNDREVQNRVVHLDRPFSDNELTQAAALINREFGGKSLAVVRSSLVDSMQADKDRMDSLMQEALDMAAKAFDKTEAEEGQELLVSGERRLLDFSSDTGQVRSLFDAISKKGRVLHLLDQCLESSGVQLFIGKESGYQPLGEMSLVTSSYAVNGQLAGVLGVIGPTRMDYKDVIPVVDVTAKVLSAAMRRN
ncbi:MAG TPA: heat-inducible transcription repressor HrcA [Gammaproteobacteria bacterium]|nr:heat-inducible transcription repressor HrcA [Gammaproteobacteria bacterium]|tara:strand:+ start:97 stop:1239 length:1143 start_codon:yes stop_codon:yes gene_type:complete